MGEGPNWCQVDHCEDHDLKNNLCLQCGEGYVRSENLLACVEEDKFRWCGEINDEEVEEGLVYCAFCLPGYGLKLNQAKSSIDLEMLEKENLVCEANEIHNCAVVENLQTEFLSEFITCRECQSGWV